jgi:hypothetical protein
MYGMQDKDMEATLMHIVKEISLKKSRFNTNDHPHLKIKWHNKITRFVVNSKIIPRTMIHD